MFRKIKDIEMKIMSKDRKDTTYIHPIVTDEEVAKIISAYSNGNGGDIIFGVKDDGITLEIKKFVFKLDLESVLKLLKGDVNIEYNLFTFKGENLFYISVRKSDELVTVNNVPYTITSDGDIDEITRSTVFISYAHKDNDLVDILEKELDKYTNIKVTRDIDVTSYRDSLDEFMQTIKEHDFTISVVSSAYIKSLNCMYEIMHLMQVKDYQKKLIFIIVGKDDIIYYQEENRYLGCEADIYDTINRLKYVTYWNKKKIELKSSIEKAGLPPESLANLSLDMRKLNAIIPSMDNFISFLSDKVGRSFTEMYKADFKEIINTINS